MGKNKVLKILNIVFTLLFVVSLSIFSYFLFQVNIIPSKYLLMGYGFMVVLFIVLIFFMYFKKGKVGNIISYIVIGIISIFFLVVIPYFDTTYSFLKNTQKKDYDTLTYSVIVLSSSNYSEIGDLNDKSIKYLDDDYKDEVRGKLSSIIDYVEEMATEFGTLPDSLLNGEIDAICLEESYLNLAKEEVEGFSDSIEIIYTFDVEVKTTVSQEVELTVSEEPFILYISGIDQYGAVSSVRGRSDVNIIAVVNPMSNHILLVNTPRDYYVQLSGTTGLRDKLTHAGIYGIDKSISTLEELYGIDINYYLRVNFNTLIQIVDIIDGIDIYSDTSFTAWTNKSVYVSEGWNHFNGEQALAYSRERHAYLDGDNHRGKNQQQVITAIINKVTQSSVLISKYNSILKSLENSFQTDMSTDQITSFIRYQLDKMPTWTIDSIAVVGSDSSNYTYSMGTNYLLYVMEPDYDSVNSVTKEINKVLSEES